MLIKDVFDKYERYQVRLDKLKTELILLDNPTVKVSFVQNTKVAGGKALKQDEKVLNSAEKRKKLLVEIKKIDYQIKKIECLLNSIENEIPKSIDYLRKKHVFQQSVSAISKKTGESASEVRKKILEAEDLMGYLIVSWV